MSLPTLLDLEMEERKPRHSPGKLIALSVIICGLVRLALVDPLGIASFATSCSHHTVKHVVMLQFKPDVSQGIVDEAYSRMMALRHNCHHPYTGAPYIANIGSDSPPEGLKDGRSHTFIIQFDSVDERDYFLLHDPAFSDFQKDLRPLMEGTTTLYPTDESDP